ncbi:HlyD family secretion protein [Spiribacter pallidus]|jgi:multidrug resistance efflux pump|uniref:HlyD family efflux transporter periplasmic adaptor subunit n=1 Tax=Spiribacter pallidus TaxID=1987936 RepID=A0ABV3T9B0_9GAMM
MRILHSGEKVDHNDQRYQTSGRFARTIYSLMVLAVIGYALYFFGRPYLVLEGPGVVTAPVRDVSVPFVADVRLVHVRPGQRVYPGALLVTLNRAGRGEALRDIDAAIADRAQDIDAVRRELMVARRMEPTLRRRMEELRDALARTDRTPGAVDLLTRAGLQREYSDARARLEENRAQRRNLPDLLAQLMEDRSRLQIRRAEVATQWQNRRVLARQSGTIGAGVISEGDSITPGEVMVRLLDQDRRYVRWELPQTLLRLPRLGEDVVIEAANVRVPGQVDRILTLSDSVANDSADRGRVVHVELDAADAERLALESSVTVRMGYF